MKKVFFVLLLGVAMGAPALIQFEEVAASDFVICRDVCTCEARETARFVRVGADCARAQNNAAAAATAAAQCNFGESSCGATSVFVSHMCFPHPVSGQTAAEAFAEYHCLSCVEECEVICK